MKRGKSSFALETNQLLEQGSVWSAVCYVALSVIGGLAAVCAGMYVLGK